MSKKNSNKGSENPYRNDFPISFHSRHYKGLRNAGTFFFVLCLLGLLFAFVGSNLAILVFMASTNVLPSPLNIIVAFIIILLPFIVPILFWTASAKEKKGMLTITGSYFITISYKNRSSKIYFDDISSISQNKKTVEIKIYSSKCDVKEMVIPVHDPVLFATIKIKSNCSDELNRRLNEKLDIARERKLKEAEKQQQET